MIKYVVITLFLGSLTITKGLTQGQDKLPEIVAERLDHEVVDIPSSLQGKKSILFVALSAKAEEVLQDWYGPVYTMFLDKSGFNALAYDCHVRLLMLFLGVGDQVSEKIQQNIRAQADQEMNELLLFVESEESARLKEIGLKKKQDAYVIVIDEKGKILLVESGSYSETKLDRVADLVEL